MELDDGQGLVNMEGLNCGSFGLKSLPVEIIIRTNVTITITGTFNMNVGAVFGNI